MEIKGRLCNDLVTLLRGRKAGGFFDRRIHLRATRLRRDRQEGGDRIGAKRRKIANGSRKGERGESINGINRMSTAIPFFRTHVTSSAPPREPLRSFRQDDRRGKIDRRGVKLKPLNPCQREQTGKPATGSPNGEMSGSERGNIFSHRDAKTLRIY